MTIDPPKSQRFEPTTMHYTTIDPRKSKIRTHDHALHHHWPSKMSNIRTHDHALHNNWSQKTKNSNPTPCTTPPLMTPEKIKIQTHDMWLHHHWLSKIQAHNHALHHHWPPKMSLKIRTHDHALHHHWPPKSQRFKPTTIDPNIKDSNPWPCTTPPLMSQKRPRTMHYTTIDNLHWHLTAFMVIDDVTAHINPKHLVHVVYDETIVPFSQDRHENA
jgi:hypothetical protein